MRFRFRVGVLRAGAGVAVFAIAFALRLDPVSAEPTPRVVSLNPSLTAILLAIGARSSLVGVDDRSARDLPEVADLPQVGGLFNPSVEGILALSPVLHGTRLEISGGVDRPPLERTPEVVALFQHAQATAAQLGFEIGEGSTGGGSDGSLTAALGIPTLDGIGVDGDGAHAEHEHILIDDLPRRAALLTALLTRPWPVPPQPGMGQGEAVR